jgi:hypothetical protein
MSLGSKFVGGREVKVLRFSVEARASKLAISQGIRSDIINVAILNSRPAIP